MIGIKWGSAEELPQSDKVIIIGSGPSLIGFDFNKLRGLGTIIAVNGSADSVPFADIWFTLDPWGLEGPQLPTNFNGRLVAAVPEDYGTPHAQSRQHRVVPRANMLFLHRLRSNNYVNASSENSFKLGLSPDPSCISTGNSGYGAFNLAYHLAPKKILMLGIDANIGYFYTDKSRNRPLTHLAKMFDSTKSQIEKSGISVINGSINSGITTYPRFIVDEALVEFKNG